MLLVLRYGAYGLRPALGAAFSAPTRDARSVRGGAGVRRRGRRRCGDSTSRLGPVPDWRAGGAAGRAVVGAVCGGEGDGGAARFGAACGGARSGFGAGAREVRVAEAKRKRLRRRECGDSTSRLGPVPDWRDGRCNMPIPASRSRKERPPYWQGRRENRTPTAKSTERTRLALPSCPPAHASRPGDTMLGTVEVLTSRWCRVPPVLARAPRKPHADSEKHGTHPRRPAPHRAGKPAGTPT